MKYPATPRESGLGWMARRERRACLQRPVRSEQRSQTIQTALALWVASIFRPSGVARRLQTIAGMRPPRALERRKIGSNAAWLSNSNTLLSACDRSVVFGAMVRLNRHVDQFVVSAQQRSIRIAALRFVRDDGNHRGTLSDADLSHMQIGHDRIAIALHRTSNFFRQI